MLSISYHYSTYFSSIFSISFHYSIYFSSIFSISFLNFLLYFPNPFTIRLYFLPYFHIISLFSSIFSLSFHYFRLYFPNIFTNRVTYLPYFPNHFTIQIVLLPYFPMFSSYQKQALTVMISPLCANCHDIVVILLNVALNTINITLYLQRHIPTYLSIYIFIRIIDFI
jgi:hypothetical protein